MKVLVDLQCCQSGSRLGGIGRYSLALATAMIRLGRQHEFTVMLNSGIPGVQFVRSQLSGVLPAHRIVEFCAPPGSAEVADKPSRTRVAELIRERFVADLAPDVLHIASLIEGLGEDIVTSVGEIFPSARTAVTLYDLIPLVEREQYLTNHILERHYLRKIEHLKRAGMLLAISEYSRVEAIEVGGIPSERVVNISSAIGDYFQRVEVPSARRRQLMEKFGIERKIVLFTGSFDIRKNHRKLIEAYSMISPELRRTHQLVMVGNGFPWMYEMLRQHGAQFGVDTSDIIFTGRVDDDELRELYSLAAAFVFPSLREGFGLPILEAMACGVPTIGSKTTSMPEVLGRTDVTFDPADAGDIARVLQRVLSDEDFRADIAAHAVSHAKRFSWARSAATALDFIERCSRPGDGRELREPYELLLDGVSRVPDPATLDIDFLSLSASAIAENELRAKQVNAADEREFRIGWVSTWNTRCGIAAYTTALADAVNWERVIFAPMGQMRLDEDGSDVYRCWSMAEQSLDRLSEAIIQSSVEVVAFQMNFGFFAPEHFNKLVCSLRDRGIGVIITLHATRDPPPQTLARRLVDFSEALSHANLVLVHALDDLENLAKVGISENAHLFPQGVDQRIVGEPRRERSGDSQTIATFGYCLPHKGLEEIIQAVSILRDRGRDVRLLLLNAEYPVPASRELVTRCKALISSKRLDAYVELVTEYLSEEEIANRLGSADLAVFAYQRTGESSSAAVRVALAAGVPTVVTPLPFFDDVADFVLRIEGSTPVDLAGGIAEWLDAVTRRDQAVEDVSDRARLWVQSNKFVELGRYFRQLVGRHV